LDKAPDAFRTISEVADDLDVPQHVLRFWESRFPQIRPMKRAGGRRYYRPDDVDLLRGIRHLLYGEGYTIRGVQRILREQGPKLVQSVWQPGAAQPTMSPGDEGDEGDRPEVDGGTRGPLRAPARPVDGDGERREPRVMPPAAGLSHEDARTLQSALHELAECRRLIDEALSEKEVQAA
jgi:DNA-binding transcriptional MerR regulator